MALLNGKRYTWDPKKGKYVEVKGANSAQTSPVAKKKVTPLSQEEQEMFKNAHAIAAMMDIERAGGVLEKYQKTVSDNLYKSGGSKNLGGINRQLSKYSANSAKFANNLRAGASAIGLSDDDLNKYLQHLEDLAPFSNDLYSITRARTGDRSVLEGVDQKSDQYKEYERLLKLGGYDATGKKLLDQNNAGSLEELTKLYGDFDLDNAVQTVETYYRMINTPAMAGVPVDPTNYEKAADDIEAFTGINVRDLAPEQVKGVLDEVGANREYIDYLQSYLKQERAAAEEAAAEAEFDNYIQQKYGQYQNAPDFAAKSQSISLDREPRNEAEAIHEAIVSIDEPELYETPSKEGGMVDTIADWLGIDRDKFTHTNALADPNTGRPSAAQQKYNASTITPEQRAIFNYLWNDDRQDEAMQYLEDIDWSVRKATAAKTEEVSEELSDGVLGGAAASIASVLASPARAITTPMNALRTAAGETIDQYDSAFNVGRASDTIRQNVGGNLDELLGNANIFGWNIGSGLYNAAMSAADSWMLAPFGATGAAAAMGLEASDSTMREALANDRTPGEALRDAGATAGIEFVTGKIPMENLFGEVVSPGKYFLTNALSEMGEELTSEGLGMLYDTIAYGDESDLGKVLADLRVHGYAGKDLTLAMVKEIAGRMRDAGFGGLAGGGFGAAGRTVTFAAENASIKKNLSGNDAVKPMLNLAETLNLPEDIRAIVQDQLKAVADGKKVSAAKIGRIFRETMKAVDEKTQSVLSASMSRNVAGMLRGVGVDDPAIAEAVTRIVADNGTAGAEDYRMVATNAAALKATEDLVSRYDTGMETQRKADEIAEAARGKVEKPAQVNNPPEAKEETEPASETDELTPEEMDTAGIQSDVQIDEQAAKEMVDAAAAEYGRNADIVAAAYEAGQDPVSFNQQFRQAYQYGEEGRNYDVISKSSTFSALNEQQIKKAYLMGRDVRVQRAQQAAAQPVGRVKVGNVDTSKIRNVKLNDYQKAAISSVSELAKAVGFNVEFVARGFDEHGKAKSNVNGTWSKETRTITLDVNAGRLSRRSANYAIMQTAGHELTHFIKAFADADLWNSYQEFVFGHLSEKMTEAALDTKIDDYIKRWAKNNKVLTRDGAIEEIVADASGDALLKLTEADIQQMAESNPSLLKRIGDFIQRWVKEVKSAIEQAYKGQIARNAIADQMVDVVDELGAKWAELLKNAAQHARAVKGENVAVNAQEEVQFSLQENDRLMENAAAMNSSKGNVPDDVLKKAEMDRVKVAAFMRDDSRTLNLPEDLMGNTFFSDAAYGGTEENTTVCPRSIGADAFLDAVSDKIGRPLTVAEQVRISQDVIGAADIKEPQCIYCYVAADRAAYREFLGKYIDQRDGVIDALKNGETDTDALYEIFRNGRKDTKEMKARFDLWVDTYRQGKRLLSASDLANIGVLTAIQSDKYRQLSGDPNFAAQMKDALKYAQAASWAKKRVNYVAYNGHILKWGQNRINKLNSMYGLRMYSFSDFSPAFALENMQMVTDAAVRGLKMLAYTKVPAFAEIFADTGMNINVSVFATEVKGDNGSSIVENNLMGADWKAAQKLRSEHENVGITFVATSDAQVEWALAQDWIDVCIPYHLVRTGRTIAEIMRYKNFTAESGDTKKPGWSKADGNLSSIPAALHNNDRDTYMRLLEENNLEPRFARFVDNPNYMKLVNETRQSVTTSKPVQPIFNTDAAINALQDMANNGGYYVPVGGSEQRMYELADEFAGRVQAGEYQTDFAEDDVKFSVEEGVLTEESTEQERYELLKNATVTLSQVNTERLAEAKVNFNGMRTAEASKTLKVIAKKLGINNLNLSNSKLNMEFDYSLGNVGESASKQKNYGGSYDDLVKALTCIEQLAYNAVPIEVHSDKKTNTKKANPDLKNVYVLVSAFADGDGYVPVQMEVKEYYNRASGLYMSVTLDKIKPDVVSERRLSEDQKGLAHLLSGSKVSIAEIFESVNPDTNARFLKYVPDGFLNDEQREAKQRALGAQAAEYASYQLQDPEQITDRELLANVMESAAENQVELDFVRRYRSQMDQLDQKQADMEAAHAEMIAARKAGKKDEAIKLKNKVDILAKQIDRMDGQLLKFEAGKPLQAVVKRQRDELRSRANERIKKRVAEVRQQETEKRDQLRARMDALRKEKNDKIEQLRKEKRDKVQEVRDEKNESFARQKYLDEVKKSTGKLREMVTSPTNKKHVPQVLRQPIADFLTALDFTSAQQLNGGEATKADNQLENAMLKMKDALQKVQNSQNGLDTSGAEYFGGYMDLPAGYAETFDEIIGKVRAAIKASDGINGTPVNRMKSADLHELAKHLRILHSAINSMNALISNAKYATADAASRDTIADLDGIKAKKDQNVLFRKISDFIDWKNSVPYYAFQRMGRGGKAIFEALMDGWDKLAFNAQDLVDFTGKTYNSKEVAEWESDIKTIELGSGESVRMSTSQLMSLYCLAKREQAMGHLMGGGIRIADIEGKRGKRISQGENYILSEGDISKFRDALTDRQREVADALQADMVKRGGAWGNEISMRRFGYNMFTEENYFPVESDTNNLRAKDPNAQENSLLRLLNMSATKDLTKGANNAIVVRSIFDVYTSHMSDMAKYNALGLQILDMMKWLNYVERTEDVDANGNSTGKITTESVQKSLELAYGTEARRYIMEFIKNLNGEVEGGREDAFINKMTSNYKIAAVGANLRVGFLQITSLPRAAVAIDSKYLLAGIAKWNARKGFGKNGMSARAVDKVGIAKWKSMGFYDTNISRNMRQMIKHDESAIDKVREGSMKLAELGDAWTMGVLYGAVESELMAQGKKPGDPTWDAMMNKRMREIVYRTQVVDSTMTRSHLMRQRGFISSAMAFMSEPTLALNMVNDALFESRMNIRAGVKWNPATAKKVAKVFAVSAVVNGLAALMEAAFTAMRDDDEFETFADKYLEALLGDYSDAESFGDKWSAFFGSALGGKLNPLSNIPVISDWIDAYKSGGDEQMWQAAAGELGEGIRALIKVMREGGTLADYYRAGYKTLGGASKAVGLPASNAVRDLASLYNTFAAEPMGWRRLQTYDNTESEAAAAILDAMIAGDNEKVAKIRERTKVYRMDNEKIEKSLSVRTKDAYMRGLLTKTEADKLMMNEGGMRARDADNALMEADYQIATGLKHSDMKDDFIEETITEKQARDYLKKYDGLRDDEIDDKINLWKYEKDTGYVYSEMKADFIDGELTESQVKSYRAKYGGSDDDAIDETLGHWKYERDTGLAWSDMEDDYADGVISEKQARSYLAKYGGKDEEEVEEKISNFDYHIATGRSTTAPKYWRIAYAFDSGGNYGAYIDEAFNSIMYGGEKTKTWKQARSQIASSLAGYYKNQYLAARGTAAGNAMLERILDLYEAIGYDREYERQYIAENWVKEE